MLHRITMADFIWQMIKSSPAVDFAQCRQDAENKRVAWAWSINWPRRGLEGRRKRKPDIFLWNGKSTGSLAVCMLWILGDTENIWKYGVISDATPGAGHDLLQLVTCPKLGLNH